MMDEEIHVFDKSIHVDPSHSFIKRTDNLKSGIRDNRTSMIEYPKSTVPCRFRYSWTLC